MTIVLSVILSIYLVLVLILLAGWRRLMKRPVSGSGKIKSGISVVVACRNEADRIGGLVESLSKLAYPSSQFEVLFADDHSSDQTFHQLSELVSSNSNFRILRLPDPDKGKKSALRLGISESRFDIIATTDADCVVQPDWLSYLSLYFENDKTHLVAGPVELNDSGSFFAKLQSIEFSSLTGSTAAAISLGHPIMCNGANLAFRKKTFNEVGGYEDNLHLASGDDEFLMRKISKGYPGGVAFMGFQDSSVSSQPQKTVGELISQRLRWAGKWKHQPDWLTRLLAIFILAVQVAFIGLVVIEILHLSINGLVFIVLKVGFELAFLLIVSSFFHKRLNVMAFLILQMLYPVYVTFLGILSLFLPYRWKGRNYK